MPSRSTSNRAAMPLVDLEAVRAASCCSYRLDRGCARLAPAARHAAWSISSSAQPAAVWQNQGQLTLIDADGVLLEPVDADAMPDLPLVIGPGAERAGAGATRR